MEHSVISMEDVCFSYSPQRPVLENISLQVNRYRRLAVLGPNGAGKSTLLLLMNGTLSPRSGQIRINGGLISRERSQLAKLHREIGIVLQDPDDQLFAPTVEQDVAFGLLNVGISHPEARARVTQVLSRLGVAGLARRPVHELSLGEKKRVALAGVLVLEPKLVLLDEPTAGLDDQGVTALLEMLEDLHRGRVTVVITTHETDFAYQWADEAAILDCGRVITQGIAKDVLSQADVLQNAHLRMPWIVDVAMQCRALCRKLNEAPLPRTRDELFEQMRMAVANEQVR